MIQKVSQKFPEIKMNEVDQKLDKFIENDPNKLINNIKAKFTKGLKELVETYTNGDPIQLILGQASKLANLFGNKTGGVGEKLQAMIHSQFNHTLTGRLTSILDKEIFQSKLRQMIMGTIGSQIQQQKEKLANHAARAKRRSHRQIPNLPDINSGILNDLVWQSAKNLTAPIKVRIN